MNSLCPAFLIFGTLLKFEYRTVKLDVKVGWDLPSGNISSAGAFSAFRPNKRGLNLDTEQDTLGSFSQSALKWNQHFITYSTEGDLTKWIGKNTSVCNSAVADTWMSKPGIISSSKSRWKIICSITLIIKAIASLMGLFLNTAMKSLTDFFSVLIFPIFSAVAVLLAPFVIQAVYTKASKRTSVVLLFLTFYHAGESESDRYLAIFLSECLVPCLPWLPWSCRAAGVEARSTCPAASVGFCIAGRSKALITASGLPTKHAVPSMPQVK